VSTRDNIATDIVLSPFGADAAAMVDAARCLDESGFDGVWTLDHFSGSMLDRPWSREPFTVLGAMAAVTSELRVGPLVANMVNRHPALLASAASTLQSIAGGRSVLGLGSGAARGSRFAAEQDAIGRVPGPVEERRRHLVETIEAVRLLWGGGGVYNGTYIEIDELHGVVGPEAIPPIIVGASGPQTVGLACEHADGVNIRVTDRTPELVHAAVQTTSGSPFEIAIYDDLDVGHPHGGAVDAWIESGVTRRTLMMSPPFDLVAIAALGDRLNA
jgi:alkanesulfonate monooxygenase SsuD/methylene tetrahydromethanopterin reductase-like flavin-dependent oxidoreductase (luciferase family)